LTAKAGFVDQNGQAYFLPPRSPDWAVVTEAGIYEISRQCDQYLDVLFHFNRNQRALRQGLTAVGATTATILGLASVAAAPIAITAAAFGLSASLFDAGVNSVLFTIEPSALRNIVLRGRKAYLDDLYKRMADVTTRPRMMIALQGYLTQCSPATIEANVNNAASGALSVANKGEAGEAATLAAPGTTLIARAKEVTSQQVIDRPPPIPQDARPRGATAAESGLTRADVIVAQRALGVTPADGNFTDQTRTAINEFGRGMNARSKGSGPADDNANELTGKVRALLLSIRTPMPDIFKSPFERAFFGDEDASYTKPNVPMLNGYLVNLQAPPNEAFPSNAQNSDAENTAKLVLMRKVIGGPLTFARYAAIPRAG